MIRFFKAAARAVRAEYLGGAVYPFGAGVDFGQASLAGPRVSAETALNLSTVWACTAATAQLVASLPCGLFEKDRRTGKRIRIEDTEEERIAFRKPNQRQTGFEFWEGATVQQMLNGNGYARKLRIGSRVVGLDPLLRCVPRSVGGRFEYVATDEDGRRHTFAAADVLHMRGFGAGGGIGMSAVRYGTQSLGAALAADQSAGAVFKNGMQPSAVIETDAELKPEQRAQFAKRLESFAGSTRAGKVMTLEHGFKWKSAAWNPEDVQLLETRAFQVAEICRWFGVPPIVIGHANAGQTMWGTGVEAILLGWMQTGIAPILRRNEARLDVDFVPQSRAAAGRLFWQYDSSPAVRMDAKTKAIFLSSMGTSGTMTANERREVAGLDPHDDPQADALLAQTALAPLHQLLKEENT